MSKKSIDFVLDDSKVRDGRIKKGDVCRAVQEYKDALDELAKTNNLPLEHYDYEKEMIGRVFPCCEDA